MSAQILSWSLPRSISGGTYLATGRAHSYVVSHSRLVEEWVVEVRNLKGERVLTSPHRRKADAQAMAQFYEAR